MATGSAARHWTVDFKGRGAREALLKTAAAALALPPHFGGNLDALYDCLTDLELGPDHEHSITLADLPRTPAGDAVHAVFADAAEFWRERGVRLAIRRP